MHPLLPSSLHAEVAVVLANCISVHMESKTQSNMKLSQQQTPTAKRATEKQTQRHRDTNTEKQRHRDTETERHRETETQTATEPVVSSQ